MLRQDYRSAVLASLQKKSDLSDKAAMEDERVRCDKCGGLNPPGATWCGQCYMPFAELTPAPAEVAAPAEGAAPSEPSADVVHEQDKVDTSGVVETGFQPVGELPH
jgi:hypothetical protein